MVEGPGCKLKGERLKKLVCGQTVKKITETSTKTKSFDSISNCLIEDVKTLGKELFVFFSGTDFCLRVHFLMNGSICYNDRCGLKKSPSFVMQLSIDTVHIYESCISLRSRAECLDRYNSLHNVDICSPTFHYTHASELLAQRVDGLICDAIMDQDVLPGVGNIIKNEALFNSGISPLLRIGQLNGEQIMRLLHRLRDFAALFYKCRKESSDLSRHYKIYGQQSCVQCKGKVTVCKPGDLKRVTYFCAACQGNGNKLPGSASGSLLHFFQPRNKDDASSMWHCTACTLLNTKSSSVCSVCLTPQKSSLIAHNGAIDTENVAPTLSDVPSTSDGASGTEGQQSTRKFLNNITLKRKSNGEEESATSATSKAVKFEVPPAHNQQVLPPTCHQHKVECVRKQVTKTGENRGRPFYVCSLPRAKQCTFFKWGDDSYPRCRHNKVTVLRSVLKLNNNNGKQFYCCSLPKNTQCDFFEWHR